MSPCAPRRRLIWPVVLAATAVLVAYQTVSADRAPASGARPHPPTVTAGTDVLDGLAVWPARPHRHDYRRAAFGAAWDDDTDAPGGRNGCDTRNDILNRDLEQITAVATTRCPNAVATGVLHDPYGNATVAFTRGAHTGQAVQIDHLVPLAYAWDMGAHGWAPAQRRRFANDPANLLAVAGAPNQDKGDSPPADWMPPNTAFACQYAMQFIAVLRGYGLPVDAASVPVLRTAADSCPVG
ncbi:HNH endonuclease [Mycolicibacillus parakoreensis]|uniref:HNH endonuclease family protein n=1 Tax=Mycolicibacillus parakoreensis TaxID=1069221 RepID=A0ABY3TVR3_9MYCO|nr:HNH endonuclease family protein [Mycolicibacillus parakoreensis]MCV7315840.1 HNH endonuclease [Mycolicibacillus parakoreensis]ULN51740.1 HNH endonuclease family protein [Mycolicibacillus parakoreensis]